MSKARLEINNKSNGSVIARLITYTTGFVNSSITWGQYGFMASRYIGWFVVTTGLITALPLVLEIKREMMHEELGKHLSIYLSIYLAIYLNINLSMY
jgi:hypothetical protein